MNRPIWHHRFNLDLAEQSLFYLKETNKTGSFSATPRLTLSHFAFQKTTTKWFPTVNRLIYTDNTQQPKIDYTIHAHKQKWYIIGVIPFCVWLYDYNEYRIFLFIFFTFFSLIIIVVSSDHADFVLISSLALSLTFSLLLSPLQKCALYLSHCRFPSAQQH